MIDPSSPPEALGLLTSTSQFALPAGGARAGGDWCDVLELSEATVALVLGDVAGHGASVAGKMESIRAALLQAIRKHGAAPSAVLEVANRVACEWGDGTLATAIVAILNRSRQTLTFANAGHPPPLVLSGQRHAFVEHRPADIPLGVFSKYAAADYVITLPVDSLLVLYTDGITEHDRDPVRGEEELVEAARFAYGRPELPAAQAICRRILRRKRGDDDAAAITLRTHPVPR